MSPHIMLFLLFFSTRSADSNCSNVYIVNDTCENNCCYHTIDGAINASNHTLSDSNTIYIQSGDYFVDTPIQITNSSLMLTGYSANSTTITVNISSHALFTCSDGQITFKDITIRDANVFTISSYGLSTIDIQSVYIIHSYTQWLLYDQSTVRVQSSTLFESNISYHILYATNITFTQCHFISNVPMHSSTSLLRLSHSSQLNMQDNVIESHYLPYSSFIRAANDVSIFIRDTTFRNNTIRSDGSILYIANTHLKMDRCTFDHNPALYSAYNSNINITSSVFSHCSSDCIRSNRSSLYIQSSSFFDSAVSFITDSFDTELNI
eukprot:1010886_1